MRKNIAESSIVIISHQERILNVADEIVLVNGGRVEKKGSKEEILPELLRSSAVVSACAMNTEDKA